MTKPRRVPRGHIPYDAIDGAVKRVEMHLRADSEHLAHETIRYYFRERDEQRAGEITDDSPVTTILDNMRVVNMLEQHLGVMTIRDLRRLTKEQVSDVPNLGEKAWTIIETELNKLDVAQLLKGSVGQITGGDDE